MKTMTPMNLLLTLSTFLFTARGLAQLPAPPAAGHVLECYNTSVEVSYILSGHLLQARSNTDAPPATDLIQITAAGQTQPPQPVRYLYRGWTVHEAHFVLGPDDAVVVFSDLDYTYHFAADTGQALAFSSIRIGKNEPQTLHCKFRK